MLKNTSWEKVGKWYGGVVGVKGHYYHRTVILPNVLRLLNLKADSRVLDLGCGQGVLAREVGAVEYLGLDLAANLIEEARSLDRNPNHKYGVADITRELPIRNSGFSHGVIILALQNVDKPFNVIRNAAKHLSQTGRLVIVINHPAFRIPKNSDWTVNRVKKIQSRVVDKYLSPLRIPIDSSPFDNKNNQRTWSYHYPLSAYSEMLFDNGFVIEKIEEWVSPKKSEGGMAKIEDDARREFPLFMAITARKI